jgi:hypothetical protein
MFGEWLSLVEHLVRDQGVGGSNPLSPTNKTADSVGLNSRGSHKIYNLKCKFCVLVASN